MTFSTSCDGSSLLERTQSSVVSNTCANETRSSRPKAPAPPLIECTARKTALTVSGSRSPSFSFRRPDSSSASCSSHSWKKISLISFISIGRIPGLGGYTLDCIDQLGGIERLDDPACRTRLSGAVLLFGVAFGGQHEDGDRTVLFVAANAFDEAETVEARHVDVRDDDVRV